MYVLDGSDGALHMLGPIGNLAGIAWSVDGNWLAYQTSDPASGFAGPLVVIHADGSAKHRIASLPGAPGQFRWSPTADTLAISVPGTKPFQSSIWLASPTGRPAKLVDGGSAEWSPDGKTIAYVAAGKTVGRDGCGVDLKLISSNGGHSRLLESVSGGGIIPAGRWPDGKGLLYWFDEQYSQSLAADGMPLYSVALDGNRRRLATMLGSSAWIASPSAGERVSIVSGVGRQVWHNKTLAFCDLIRAACTVPSVQAKTVSLDPTISPSGSRIAYVSARDLGPIGGFGSSAALDAWVHSRSMWLIDSDGSGAHRLRAAGTGIYWPHWSLDGNHLLYVRDLSVWLVGRDG